MKENNNYLSFEEVEKMSQEERQTWIERWSEISKKIGIILTESKDLSGYTLPMTDKIINPKDIGELIL